MFVNKEELDSIAELSRLNLDLDCSSNAQSEIEKQGCFGSDHYLAELNAAINALQILHEADTAGVEPCYSSLQENTALRPDCAVKMRTVDEILANAPEREGRFFAVPSAL